MAKLHEIHTALGYGEQYDFEGTLFVDSKRDTATLYLEMTDLQTKFKTPQLRIGFNNFKDSNIQYQTRCQVKETGEYVSGISCKIYIPVDECPHYQIDIMLNEKERYTVFWAPENSSNNCAASSKAQLTPFEELFQNPSPVKAIKDSTKLRKFINQGEL